MVILVVLSMVAGAEPAVMADPMCSIDESRVFFHVEIDTKWTDKKGEPRNENEILQLNCDRQRKTCAGAVLRTNLRSSSGGRLRVGMMDLVGVHGAELKSVKGQVAVIEWGVHQLIVDTAAGTVTKSANSANGGERGVGSCKLNEQP